MEFSTEINKIFGEEMAKLFVSTISEEEMTAKANEIWKNMNKSDNSWGNRQEPEIVRIIKSKIVDKIYNKIENILKEPIEEEVLEKRAREMVETARKAGEEAIIKAMTTHMVQNTLSAYNSHDAIVDEVLRKLRVDQNGIGYRII